MSKRIIEAAIYSHSDKNTYSAKEVADKVMRCYRAGAAIVHVHITKLKSMAEFLKLVGILEKNNGPKLSLSSSDFERFLNEKDGDYACVKYASLDIGKFKLFGNEHEISFETTIKNMEMLLAENLCPEICIFNQEGINECIKLQELFPNRFWVGIYMGYPDSMEATQENMLKVIDGLKDINYKLLTILDNNEKMVDLIKLAVMNGFNVRCGEEDGYRLSMKDSEILVNTMVGLVKECDFEVEKDADAFMKELN